MGTPTKRHDALIRELFGAISDDFVVTEEITGDAVNLDVALVLRQPLNWIEINFTPADKG